MYRQDEFAGRSWPDVATASRPAIGLGASVPPLPRSSRPATVSSRETGRIALEDRPRPVDRDRLRPALSPAAPSPTPLPSPRAAADDTASAHGPRTSVEVVSPADAPADEERTAPGPADGPRRRRRLPAAPGRRPALLLAALVVGALIAALPGGGDATSSSAASGLDYGLGMEADTGFAGGVEVAGARGEISQAEAEARLNEIAASRAARAPKFFLPTEGRLTTCFCMRWGSMHWGLDLAAPLGTPILSAAEGVVLRAGAASGYGKAIYIQDADGDVHVYGHMRHLLVEAGDVVAAGDLIAKVGNEGQSTGPHLHYEIHKGGINGKPIDPEDWLGERGISVR
ncbi:peptidoglycan DD-metalloendopeptidase family protein [Modestobacter sp. URMC 112]